jgi:hypothetical protein
MELKSFSQELPIAEKVLLYLLLLSFKMWLEVEHLEAV